MASTQFGRLDKRATGWTRQYLLSALICTIAGCGPSKPTVVLDNWWTIDYVRNACERDNSCGWDNANPAGILDYIARLITAFALSPNCKGVSVLDFRGPERANPPEPGDHETLMIDYLGGQRTQDWSIEGKPSAGLSGKGTVAEIADAACIAARSKGATLSG